MTDYSRERLTGYHPSRLHEGVVLVVGAGALSQNMLLNLALSGVGEIRIVDPDVFEDHNRTRSPFYPTAEEQRRLGVAKARVVAHKLAPYMTAPCARLRYAIAPIEQLGSGALDGTNVVAADVDTASGRAYLADQARLEGRAFVEAGFDGTSISLSCFPPTDVISGVSTPCWRCSHPDVAGAFSCRFYAERAEREGIIPAIQTAAATLAGLQAEAVIQALHGAMPLANSAIQLDIRTARQMIARLATDPLCPGVHRTRPATRHLLPPHIATLSDLLEAVNPIKDHTGIELPDPLVWEAMCTTCGSGVRVAAPEWRWRHTPLCTACGGPWPHTAQVLAPEIHPNISTRTPTEILAMRCPGAGVMPGAVLDVHHLGGVTAVKLAGGPNDLFVDVSEDRCGG